MQKPSSWRELLASIISNPAERERIAAGAGVRPITLTRWSNGESKPRLQNLRSLIKVLPTQHQDPFRELIEGEESLSSSVLSGEREQLEEIPYKFINEVLTTRASSPEALLFWAVSHLILQHALRHLDPEPVGMSITVVQCMPPVYDGKIHSLRERTGLGTPPWPGDLEHQGMFLGAESLAGHVVSTGHYEQIQDLREEHMLLPAYQVEYEVSASAHPIMYTGRIAGCLLVSSTLPNYFLSPSRTALINGYANLLALAFKPEEFYELEVVELSLMPPLAVQRAQFADFRQRVARIMQQALAAQQPVNSVQAEQTAWQQLEEELRQLSLQTM